MNARMRYAANVMARRLGHNLEYFAGERFSALLDEAERNNMVVILWKTWTVDELMTTIEKETQS